MPVRNAVAEWKGNLTKGSGSVQLGSGLFESAYSFNGRVEDGVGTTPEELIAAAHASCYAMALAADLAKAGFIATRLTAKSKVELRMGEAGLKISGIKLVVEGEVPGIDEAKFLELAEGTKSGCPVAVALANVPITLNAKLVG